MILTGLFPLIRAARPAFLIEFQTFVSNTVRIVNDRSLITLSDQPNGRSPITTSLLLGQSLASNTPVGSFHDKGDIRKDFIDNATLLHRFWLG